MNKKFLSVLMAFALILTVFSPGVMAASEDFKSVSDEDLQALVHKVDRFVELDQNSKKYKLNKDAKKSLDKETIKLAEQLIGESNKASKSELADFSVSEDGKSLEYVMEQKQSNQVEGVSTLAASGVKITVSKMWYGYYAHFNHAAVQAFKNNLLLYGASIAGINLAMQGVFALAAMTLPGWFGALLTVVSSLGAWAFINADKGCGTNVRIITTPLPGGIIPMITNAC